MFRFPGIPATSLGLALLSLSLLMFCGRDEGPSGPDGETGTVTVIVVSTPDSAEILIDDVRTGAMTPDTLSTTPGSHTIKLELCDYEAWSGQFQGSDGDTLTFDRTLDLKFDFFDDFESGAEEWTAGCPFSFEDSGSHDGSGYILILNDDECSTRLIPAFELPTCLEPSVSFWYKLPGSIIAELRIDADAGSHYERLADRTPTWTRVEVPTEELQSLVGTAVFTFAFTPSGSDTFRFSLDDFSIRSE